MARRHARRLPHLVAGLLLAVTLAGCAATEAPAVDAPATDLTAVDDRTLLDVRTPAETAQGHLEGALLIDLQADDFAARIDALPRDEPYLVYCRSGNRSAEAIAVMTDLGFTDVVNGGGYDDLVAAGMPTA